MGEKPLALCVTHKMYDIDDKVVKFIDLKWRNVGRIQLRWQISIFRSLVASLPTPCHRGIMCMDQF